MEMDEEESNEEVELPRKKSITIKKINPLLGLRCCIFKWEPVNKLQFMHSTYADHHLPCILD